MKTKGSQARQMQPERKGKTRTRAHKRLQSFSFYLPFKVQELAYKPELPVEVLKVEWKTKACLSSGDDGVMSPLPCRSWSSYIFALRSEIELVRRGSRRGWVFNHFGEINETIIQRREVLLEIMNGLTNRRTAAHAVSFASGPRGVWMYY